jgi:hypothetical protein
MATPRHKSAGVVKVKAYKAFNKEMKCRDFQFEVGKTYTHEGKVKACESGFHSCENPLDVLNYYNLCDSRFAIVEASGEIAKHGDDSKIASASITIEAELHLPQFIAAAVDWIKSACTYDGKKVDDGDSSQLAASGDYSKLAASGYSSKLAASGYSSKLAASGYSSQLAASGDSSQLAASGDYSKLSASGDSSKLAASGDSSQLAASGNYSQLAASGDSSQLAASGDSSQLAASTRLQPTRRVRQLQQTLRVRRLQQTRRVRQLSQLAASGNYSKLAASGDYSKLAASGTTANYSQLAASGDYSIAVSSAPNCQAKAGKNGTIVLTRWVESEKRYRVSVGYVGENIKADTWYKLDDDGNFVEYEQ